jgi:tRNA(Ile)-lysidine synthetase-like protein
MRKDFGIEQIFFQNLHKLLIRKGEHVLLALSGGLDSMCLLRLAIEAGLNITAFHYNFRLRGAESDLDELLVTRECRKLKIPLIVKRASRKDFASSGIQSKARELRYKAIEDLYSRGYFRAVFTAHHADDIAETVLMNLSRGTGISGLKGLPVSRAYIIRPLFNLSKKAIASYAKKKRIAWREDQSNASLKYRRNVFRNAIIPQLEKTLPGIGSGLSKSALQVSSEWDNFHFLLEKMKNRGTTEFGSFQVFYPGELITSPHPHALGLRLFPEWNLSAVQWSDLIKALLSSRSGAHFFGKNHEVLVYKSLIFFRKKTDSLPLVRIDTSIHHCFDFIFFSFFHGRVCGFPSFNLPANSPLNICTPSPGDRLVFPDGSQKSLLKVLHKEAIHPWYRTSWPVFKNPENQILAVPGYFSFTDSLFYSPETEVAFWSWL